MTNAHRIRRALRSCRENPDPEFLRIIIETAPPSIKTAVQRELGPSLEKAIRRNEARESKHC